MRSEDKLFAWMIGALLVIAAIDSWEDVERARNGCKEAPPALRFKYESDPEPVECKPSAEACKAALAEECHDQADAGTWEAIPFCHNLDRTDQELEDAVKQWNRDAGALWEGIGQRL